jgi:hypothetical protein
MADPYASASRSKLKVQGSVENISSSGMFLNTFEYLPIHGRADILIDFYPDANSPEFSLEVKGIVIRMEKYGVGIRFTSINTIKLKQCIINRLNKGVEISPSNS